jgi:predicted phosphoribosyltransferase
MPFAGKAGKDAMSFENRSDAGRRLALALTQYRAAHPVVLALPRGGVVVAAEIALALEAPFDLLLVRKLGVPSQRELAMGAVADGGALVRNEDVLAATGVTAAEFAEVERRERVELERRRRTYLGDRPPVALAGRTVVLVDDGVATGATTRVALRAVRARGAARLVLAVPVAPADTLADLRPEADEIVCLERHVDFAAIGEFYRDFQQVGDEEVVRILERMASRGIEENLHPGS